MRHAARELGDSHFIIARTPFDGTYPREQTVGMEACLMKMIADPEFAEKAVAGLCPGNPKFRDMSCLRIWQGWGICRVSSPKQFRGD